MKHSKRCKATIGAFVWGIVCLMIVPLGGMISQKSTSKRIRLPQPVQQEQAERYKSKLIWVKTSDNIRMELPLWQIDQMKALQHKGEHMQYHWVDAPMITSDELALVQKALNVADNLEKWKNFYSNLPEDQKESLVASASKLEMQKLTSLLMTYFFPVEMQGQLGAMAGQVVGVIAPVVEYLQASETIPLNHKGSVLSIALSPDGTRIISGATGIDHNLILYDLKVGKEIKNLVLEAFPIPCVAFSPDGKYIAAGSTRFFDNLIIWDGSTGDQLRRLNGFRNSKVACIAFSPDSKSIAIGRDNLLDQNNLSSYNAKIDSVIIYDVITGNATKCKGLLALPGVYWPVFFVAFSPNSKNIIIGTHDCVMIRDIATDKLVKEFSGAMRGEGCMAIGLNGKYIVAGSSIVSNNLIVTDVETGKQVVSLEGHDGGVNCVAFSPDGNYIASGSKNSKNNLLLWDAHTGEHIKSALDFFTGEVNCVAFSPDSNYLFCGGRNGLVAFKIINEAVLDYIANKLNIAQARFLYRLYLAKINKVPVIMDSKDLDYQLYLTLPHDVQKVVKAFLPFELLSDVTEKAVQEKMKEYRSLLFYSSSYFFGKSEKTRDQKIKAIKDTLRNLDKDSIDYKACERLLRDLELEAAFEV